MIILARTVLPGDLLMTYDSKLWLVVSVFKVINGVYVTFLYEDSKFYEIWFGFSSMFKLVTPERDAVHYNDSE